VQEAGGIFVMDGRQKRTGMIYQKGHRLGQYTIVSMLNQSRFSNTYLGQHQQNGMPVSIEVLQPPLVSELKDPFLEQAQSLMTLEHPHILRIYDAGVDNFYPFLVTSYLPFSTFREAFPQGSVQSLANILPYFKQIASALQYAHERRVLHAAVNPDNLVLTKDNPVALLRGFTLDAITQNREKLNYQRSVISRSVAYSAPERLSGTIVHPGSDQYSLAIMLYELLTGELPFSGSYIEVADMHLHATPPSLQQKAAGISAGVEQVIMTALAKDPGRRFGTIQTFINALESEYNAQPGRTMVPPPQQYAPPPMMQEQRTAFANPPQTTSPAFASQRPPTAAMPPEMMPPAPVQPPMTPPMQAPAVLMSQGSIPTMRTPPQTPPPADSPLAPRRGGNTITRRVFAAGLVAIAAAGGAGGWYYFQQRTAQPVPPTVVPGETPPIATPAPNQPNAQVFTGHLASVNSLVWSPKGNLIASASDDRTVQIFDATTGQRQIVYNGHAQEVATVAWSPNGNLIATGGQDSTVQIWEAATGKLVFTYKKHTDRVNALSWAKDNQRLLSGGEDKTVQVWNVTNGTQLFNFRDHTKGVLCVGWQPDNTSVASGSWDGSLRGWAITQHGQNYKIGQQMFNYGGHGKAEINTLAWSPDSKFLVSAGASQTAQITAKDTGTPQTPFFTEHQSKTHANSIRAIAWSPDGKSIASGDSDGVVFVWSVATRKSTFKYEGHKGSAINALMWSPDGKRIASASADKTVQIWAVG
jgi:WD40 repeat protein/serine/threonine protein kinase